MALLVACAACSGPPVPPPRPVAVRPPLPVPAPVVSPQAPPVLAEGLGPEILLPSPDAADAEVARVGELVLRQSHAYARLLSAHPKLALSAVDLLVFDVLVARHAEQFGIRVDPSRVEELAQQEEEELRRQVATELAGVVDFQGYVMRLFGMHEDDWRQALRLRTAQRLYQGYVLRYLAMLEDRVQVRFVVHKDPKVVEEVVAKVRVGADFGTLALRWSEDASKRDGGLLPPFGRDFQHPAAKRAFDLTKGQVSDPFEAPFGGETRWFAVYCVDHLEGRQVPFAAVRDEIDRQLAAQPISQIETTAYTLRWRDELAPRPESPPASATTDR